MNTLQKLLKALKAIKKLTGQKLNTKSITNFTAQLIKFPKTFFSTKININYQVECFGKDGTLKWKDGFNNLVVNTGLDDILDKYWLGSGYSAAHTVGLTDGTPTVDATDTMASHAGWTEVTAYDEGNRLTLTLGAVSGQSVDNSANRASFTIDTGSTTIGGCFVSTSYWKGGVDGSLVGAGAFTGGDKTADDDDVLNVTVTITESAS